MKLSFIRATVHNILRVIMRYWLFKSEPETFSIDDLKERRNSTEHWTVFVIIRLVICCATK